MINVFFILTLIIFVLMVIFEVFETFDVDIDIPYYLTEKKVNKIIDNYFKEKNLPKEYKIFFEAINIYSIEDIYIDKKNIKESFLKILIITFKRDYIDDCNPISKYKSYFPLLSKKQDIFNILKTLSSLDILINSFLELNYILYLNEKNIKELDKNIEGMYDKKVSESYITKQYDLKSKNIKLVKGFVEFFNKCLENDSKMEDKKKSLISDTLLDNTQKQMDSFNDKLSGYKNLMK